MASYEAIYSGADDYLMPRYNPMKYETGIEGLGMSTDPRTANQLGELNLKLNPGMKHVEVGAIQGAVMESIPEQHLDEIRRVSKLTGVTLSLHAPIVEASGIGEGKWEEANRIAAEKQLESALLRAHKLDPKGNVPVTTHSSANIPELVPRYKEDGKEKITTLYVVDPETGKMGPIPYTKKFFPKEGEKGGEFNAEAPREFNEKEEIEKINKDMWSSQLADINRHSAYGEERIEMARERILRGNLPEDYITKIAKGEIDLSQIKDKEDEEKIKLAQRELTHGQIYLREAYRNLKNVFDSAYISSTGEDKEKLKKFANEISPMVKKGIEEDPRVLGQVLEKGLKVLGEIKKTPETYKPLQEFAVDQAAKTFANVATSAYKKFGDTAPILNIENPPAGMGLSRAEDLKAIIEKSREKFVENMQKEGVSKSQAKQAAEKLIGATWDVGHINMLRKRGYTEEDIIKQAETIAPFVKHVHLSDNFGLDHTELPMGMGNVPMKEVMAKLGEKGFEGKKIIEAGNWWQYFAEKGGGNPFKPSIEAFDSPIYTMAQGPYWSQLGGFGAYYMGHGPINPAVHHKIYGSGFEALPLELGGEIPGTQSRFSGTPNQ